MNNNRRIYKPIKVRHNVVIDKELFDQIVEEADAALRSVSAQIAFYCAEGIKRERQLDVLPRSPVKVL